MRLFFASPHYTTLYEASTNCWETFPNLILSNIPEESKQALFLLIIPIEILALLGCTFFNDDFSTVRVVRPHRASQKNVKKWHP